VQGFDGSSEPIFGAGAHANHRLAWTNHGTRPSSQTTGQVGGVQDQMRRVGQTVSGADGRRRAHAEGSSALKTAKPAGYRAGVDGEAASQPERQPAAKLARPPAFQTGPALCHCAGRRGPTGRPPEGGSHLPHRTKRGTGAWTSPVRPRRPWRTVPEIKARFCPATSEGRRRRRPTRQHGRPTGTSRDRCQQQTRVHQPSADG
jgi:hypothetical protein